MKTLLVAVAFVLIIGSLISALYFMNRDRGTTKRMVWSLAARVGLSITLFLALLLAYWLGWIEPTGLPIGR
ncbi:twin transmembrane helix small protein [Burkholderia sp. Ac-20353]|uniref:twin transmembrane helix small protein n=1 Tax=Burkholderia sp. Ac-20353 TaxID=2703894 RepID=UPI00197C2249|nr:twin transmembrane helix small protein [Burkholderia sp. Ac-20353]MBN3786888.1 twin transmembrane helix small protein [Burkholderia sp. Ac-20353]